jgi:hypothetical protein
MARDSYQVRPFKACDAGCGVEQQVAKIYFN